MRPILPSGISHGWTARSSRRATGSSRKRRSFAATAAPKVTASASTTLRPRAPHRRSRRRSGRLPHPETVYTDTRDAIIVFTNADYSGATGTMTAGIEKIVLDSPEPALTGEGDRLGDVRAVYDGLVPVTRPLQVHRQSQRLLQRDYARRLSFGSLGPLGMPTRSRQCPPRLRGGFVNRNYTIHYAGGRKPHPRHLCRTRRDRALGAVHDHAGVTVSLSVAIAATIATISAAHDAGRLVEPENSYGDGTDCTDSSPHRIGRAHRDRTRGNSSKLMLTATEARKATVQGRFLNPSTNRSEVVNPTSKNPPTISHNHGMAFLSLDVRDAQAKSARHGE